MSEVSRLPPELFFDLITTEEVSKAHQIEIQGQNQSLITLLYAKDLSQNFRQMKQQHSTSFSPDTLKRRPSF